MFPETIIYEIFEARCEIVHYRKSLISVLQEFSASINKISIWQEDWVLDYHSLRSRHSPDIS